MVDLELLSLIGDEKLNKDVTLKAQEMAKTKGYNGNVYNNDFIPLESINLCSNDALNIIKEIRGKIKLIEDRQNPYFETANSLNDSMLGMFSEMITKKLKDEKDEIKIMKEKYKNI